MLDPQHLPLRDESPDRLGDFLPVMRMESFAPKDPTNAGVVISAPHGGFDLFTPQVIQIVGEETAVGGVIAQGYRKLSHGWWFNVNRPTEQEMTEGRLDKVEQHTEAAAAVYQSYEERLREAGGEFPLRLLVEVHARAPLTMVTEIVTTGFSKEEMQLIKTLLQGGSDDQPASGPRQFEILGLLDSDVYRYEAGECAVQFRFKASQARKHGALRTEIAARSIHIEIPSPYLHEWEARKEFAARICEMISGLKSSGCLENVQ